MRAPDPRVHENALKHLTEEEVLEAWWSVQKSIRRESDDEPLRWLSIGFLPNGDSVELVSVETMDGWLIIHAFTPVQPKFAKEIENTRGELGEYVHCSKRARVHGRDD